MSRPRHTLALVAASVLAAAALPSVAGAEVLTVTSFDGTKINANFQAAQGLKPGQRAPTIVMTHGFGGTRESVETGDSAGALGQVSAAAFNAHGYNTVTYDSRGFGRSGGEIQLDSPDFEGRDASAVIDAVARRPEAELDAPGDPRVGLHGASYAGGNEWAAASRDKRIDALAPAISWTSLPQALGRDGRLKLGWGLLLVGLGEASGLAAGVAAPQGIELGAFPPELVALATRAAVTGRADGDLTSYLRARSTGDGVGNVRAPSLILQGTADTLFGLDQSLDMRRLLRKAGTPTKVLWFCGGHGICRTGNGAADVIQPRVLAWMDRWLRGDHAAKVGPGFEWVSDDGALRSAGDVPLKSAGTITAQGSGTLPITPAATLSGAFVAAAPASDAVEVPIPEPSAAKDVVGVPVLKMNYRGVSAAGATHVFAQLLDVERGVVVGNQTTPIPVTLDGQEHVVERPLEAVAMRMEPGHHYRLQISGGSNVYGATLDVGGTTLSDVRLTLPVGDAAGTPTDPTLTAALAGPTPGAAAPAAGAKATGKAIKRLRLASFRRPGVLLRGVAPSARRVRVSLVVSKAAAKRLGLRSRTIATGRTAKRTTWSLRVKPTAKVAKALRRRASTSATVRVSSGTVRPTRVVVRR